MEAAHDIIIDGETIEGSGLNVTLEADNHVKIINNAITIAICVFLDA